MSEQKDNIHLEEFAGSQFTLCDLKISDFPGHVTANEHLVTCPRCSECLLYVVREEWV